MAVGYHLACSYIASDVNVVKISRQGPYKLDAGLIGTAIEVFEDADFYHNSPSPSYFLRGGIRHEAKASHYIHLHHFALLIGVELMRDDFRGAGNGFELPVVAAQSLLAPGLVVYGGVPAGDAGSIYCIG